MKGIDESRLFYENHGINMIHNEFPEYENRIAVGLVGQGSECFGFDDALSRDHDFGNRFCLWITNEDDEKIGFRLMDAYQKLCPDLLGKQASLRSGVFTIDEFYTQLIGRADAPKTWQEWFSIPEYALATVVNGAVFKDDLGLFSKIRSEIAKGYPEDIKLKKLAAHLALMAQSGQYNHPRCIKRGEIGAAILSIHEFIDHAFHCLFLLNNIYLPYYKWRFRAAEDLLFLSEIPSLLLELSQKNDPNQRDQIIEKISQKFLYELLRRDLIITNEIFLEASAKELMQKIKDPEIRRLHLMEFGAK